MSVRPLRLRPWQLCGWVLPLCLGAPAYAAEDVTPPAAAANPVAQEAPAPPAPPPPPAGRSRAAGAPAADPGASIAVEAAANPVIPRKDQQAGGALRASERSAYGESGSPPPPSATGSGFDFGSYGRVGIGSDLRGHTGYGVNVVSFGSRLEEPTYLELNFYYGGQIAGNAEQRWRVVVVPAFSGDLFHYTGVFQQELALRNAYAETENLGLKGLRLWAGSRMYRGDDVYLLDFWPLDNLNTVGGGAGYRFNQDRTDLAVHLGMNRLDNSYQFQQVTVPAMTLPPGSPITALVPATTEATTLDRPRVVASFKATQYLRKTSSLPNAKLILYGEFHYLPSGTQQNGQPPLPLALPQDYGWVVGAQLGAWLRPFVFANLFLRTAGGLGAYGDLGQPTVFNNNLQVSGAREVTVALSTNYESERLGVMGAAYFRLWRDGNPSEDGGYNEGAVAVRPTLYLTRHMHLATELSYQARQPLKVNQDTGAYLLPQVFRFSVLPIVAPLGRGTYSRPIIYAVYTVSALNQDALTTLFDPHDVRANTSTVHYLGLGAEWWFNSSYR